MTTESIVWFMSLLAAAPLAARRTPAERDRPGAPSEDIRADPRGYECTIAAADLEALRRQVPRY